MDKKTAIEHFTTRRPVVIPGELPVNSIVEIAAEIEKSDEAGRFLISYARELERRIEQKIIERDEAIAARCDVPRTIVLTYTPRQPCPEKMDERDAFDSGSYWTVSEGGKHEGMLDPRECQALVACMLLGAPHPSLRSLYDYQNDGARRERRRQRCETTSESVVDPTFQERPYAD